MPELPSVGLSLPLSGTHAAIGRQADPVIKLFVEDRNAAGGMNVGGRALRPIVALPSRDVFAPCLGG